MEITTVGPIVYHRPDFMRCALSLCSQQQQQSTTISTTLWLYQLMAETTQQQFRAKTASAMYFLSNAYRWSTRSRRLKSLWLWSSSIVRAWTASGIPRCQAARHPWYWAGGRAFSYISPSVCPREADYHSPSSPVNLPWWCPATCGLKSGRLGWPTLLK